MSDFDSRVSKTEFIAAVDVVNPLCGSNGASAIFGPQKGATEEMVKVLDSNLLRFGSLIEK